MTRRHFTPLPAMTGSCHSSLEDVRALLQRVEAFLRAEDTPLDWVEDMNIILAEVLTNIARHAYPDTAGLITLEVRLSQDALRCRVSDSGRPFDPDTAGRTAPDPTLLHEGGYGWFLIRSLARAPTYRRMMGKNCLTFWVPVGSLTSVAEPAQ